MNGSVQSNIRKSIDTIGVPRFDFAAVKSRAGRSTPSRRAIRRRTAVVACFLALGLPLLAAAAAHFIPLKVTHRVGNWQLFGATQTFMRPAPRVFTHAAAEAPYRVVWPAGLPRGSKPIAFGNTASEVFTIFYQCPHGRDYIPGIWAIVIPKHYGQVNAELDRWFRSQMATHRKNLLWDVGDERVLLTTDCLTLQQMQNVRSATTAAGRAAQ